MKRNVLFWILIALILVVITFPYIKAEYLTNRYGDEFVGLEEQTNMLNSSRYFKVIEYSDSQAIVFYVSDTGDLLTFVKDENQWKLTEWKTIWSRTGSADDFMWPYYK